MRARTLLARFRTPLGPAARQSRAVLVWAITVALLLSPLLTAFAAAAAVIGPAATMDEMPCATANAGGASMAHASPGDAQQSGDGEQDRGSCPMMAGLTCVLLVAASPPGATTLDLPPTRAADHVRFVSLGLTPNVVAPPQRPPNTL